MKKITVTLMVAALLIAGLAPVSVEASQFKIAIMQDKKGAAKKFRPLMQYFKDNGIDAGFIATKNYTHAARMFADGKVDGMFSGSGIAGAMIIKELAYPLVRPNSLAGWSTYWAVVIAPKGSPKFTQNASYFKNKKVIFTSLASSGEFFFRSLEGSLNVGATMKKAGSHGAAIGAISKGAADVAIVKNRVWDSLKGKYPNLVRVGEDAGENPNGTLIISNKADRAIVANVKSVLLSLKDDNSAKAKAVKKSLGIDGYLETTGNDFQFTIPMLKKAGVTKGFNFKY